MSENSVGSVSLDLNLNTAGFNKQLKSMQGTAGKAAKLMAAAFSVKAMVNFSKQCLELGSDLQEVQNVVDVTFSTMSEKVNKFAQNAAATHGLSETMAKKYTGTFGAMSKAFGFSEKAAYDMSTTLTGLAGDVASFYNLSHDEAFTKLKSVFTGSTEPMEDLGVVMTQANLDQYALAKGLGKTTSAMTEMEKVSLRYAFVQEKLNSVTEDFIRTKDSWANQTRILSLQMESFKAAIGQGLINILTPVIKWLNLLIQKFVTAANAFKNFTETLFGKSDAGSKNTVENAAASAENVTDATNTAIEKTKKLKRELAGFDQITKLGSDDSSSGSDASSTGTSTGTSSPAVDNGTAEKVSTLAEKYEKLAGSVGNLKDKFKTFTDLMKDAGKWVYDNVLKPLGEWTVNELAPAFLDMLAEALGALASACELLKPAWGWVWDKLLAPIGNFVGDAIIMFLEEAAFQFEQLGLGFVGLKDMIASIPDNIESIKADVKKKWDALKANITGKVAEFKAKVATKWDDLKASWNKLKSNASGKVAEFKAKVATKWDDLKKSWNRLKSNASGKTADIKAKVATEWKDLKNSWNNLLSNFKDKAVSVTLNIKGKVADIKKWFNESVIDKVNANIHKVKFLENVSIPHLAQGAYVKKNTPQLAMIGDNRHQGEVVAPEGKLLEMARMAAAGAGGASPEVIALLREIVELLKTLNLDVTIEGNSLMQIIVRLINQQTKSTGNCPILV